MDTVKKAERVIEKHLKDYCDSMVAQFGYDADHCESPIEVLMLARLMTLNVGYGSGMNPFNRVWEYGENAGPNGGPSYEMWDLVIFPQQQIGPHRVDFLIVVAFPSPAGGLVFKKYIVECDGHDFHERTKEQAARDKSRDRYLQTLGYPIYRYTGSEIFKNDPQLLRDLEQAIWGFAEEVVSTITRRSPASKEQ